MIGISLRFALALGLHLRNEDRSADGARKGSLQDTWWSLHAIECLVSSITGRPPIIAADDCTVAIPQPLSAERRCIDNSPKRASRIRTDYNTPQTPISPSTPLIRKQPAGQTHYFVNHISITLISQKILQGLYSPRTATHSWEVSYIFETVCSTRFFE